MNRKICVLGIGIILGLGLTFFRPPVPGAPEVGGPTFTVRPREVTSLAESLAKPLGIAGDKDVGLSRPCQSFHRRLLTLDLKTFTDLRFSDALFDLPLVAPGAFLKTLSESMGEEDACESMPKTHPIRSIHAAFSKSCRLSLQDIDLDQDEKSARAVNWCFHLWQRYRLNLVTQASKGKTLESISDERLLVARLGVALTTDRAPGQYDDILPVVERLNQLKPQTGYDQLSRKLEFERVMETSSADEREARRTALEEKLSEMDPEGAHSLEIRVLLAKDAGNTDRMESLARKLGEISPEKGAYYLAWSAYASDQKEKAQEYLASITAPSPLTQFASAQLSASPEEAKTPFSAAGLGSGLKGVAGQPQ